MILGDASTSSHWAFLCCHAKMDDYYVRIKWSPGHYNIEVNESANKPADKWLVSRSSTGPTKSPTASGIGTEMRALCSEARAQWWNESCTKLSSWYKQWGLTYEIKAPLEPATPGSQLQHHKSLRTSYADLAWYHIEYRHDEATQLECSCGHCKIPDHMTRCLRSKLLVYR